MPRANNRNIFVEIDSAGGDYVTSGSFDTSNGIVTLTRLSGGTVNYDLDGRYLPTSAFTDTNIFVSGATFGTTNGVLEFTNTSGGTFNLDLDGRYLPLSSSTITTATNGLTKVGDTVILGGTLTGSTTITQGTNSLTFDSSTSLYNLLISNTNTNGSPLRLSALSAPSVWGYNTSTLNAAAQFSTTNFNTNDIHPTLQLARYSTGTVASGFGTGIEFELETSTDDDRIASEFNVSWTDATDVSRTSRFSLQLANNATLSNKLVVEGNGQVTLNNYGINTFTGTAAYNLSVDSSGNIIETPNSSSSGIIVEEFGGSPSVSGVTKVVFSGGTVIDDGGGQVTVQSSGGGGGSGISWSVVTGNTTCAFSTGYIANSASLITFTLPTTNTVATIRVTGKGSGGWQVDVPASWTIYFAGQAVTDNLQSNDASDSIELLGIGDNAYQVISSIGNITFNNL